MNTIRPTAALPLFRPAAHAALVCLLALGTSAPVWAQGRSIFTCVSASGKTLTSDRLIAECVGREQRVLNPDGSLNRIVPPTLTADERAQADERERVAAAAREARAEAVRRDRTLMQRYPNEAAHQRARESALGSARKLLQASEQRLAELVKERPPLLADAEFYAGKPLPPKLKAQLDANDVSTEGQRTQIEAQKAEIGRIEKSYDAELERLKKLWAGAPPGSLDPQLAAASAASRGK
ncbi:MAG TPA: hypothetical protein VNU71_08850 [Burkholderiaceae bacterium]|nr:hypothetical protein [Burkholderiaceae bacterium]